MRRGTVLTADLEPWGSASLACALVAGLFVGAAEAAPGGPAAVPAASAADLPARGVEDFRGRLVPLFDGLCGQCHGEAKKKGGIDFGVYRGADETRLLAGIEVWQKVAAALESGEMPPEGERQPTEAERDLVTSWIDWADGRAAAQGPKDPGRVTLRRLNRAEYDNTIRDLLGIDLSPAKDFPSDDVGYGFDNIGDVLSMPPVLVERYMAAAARVAEKAIVAEIAPRRRVHEFAVARLAPTPPGSFVRRDALVLTSAGSVGLRHELPIEAEYEVQIRAQARGVGRQPLRLVLRVEGRQRAVLEIRSSGKPTLHKVRLPLEAGRRRFELVYLPPEIASDAERGSKRQPELALDRLRIDGPLGSPTRALPASHTRIITRSSTEASWREDAKEFLAPLATRAFRRPVEAAEVERLVALVESARAAGQSFEKGMQLALRALLTSPHFLYRIELDPGDPTNPTPHPVSDYELASRLSYFLWSSLPDEALFRRAAEGTLRQPGILAEEARRMLRDEKSRALVDNFASQWLQIRNLATHRPARDQFPSFDDQLRNLMIRETELFVEAVIREDLPVRALLDADFTYLNERLARHYDIEGIEGSAFRRVSLSEAGSPRGGLLSHGSILTVTSNPTRTSPVKRGRWILEQILGTPPPPPPADVPDLSASERKGDKSGAPTSTLRERLEAHRENPECAVCHRKMDPLGFSLENFDAVGAWRTEDEAGRPVDVAAVLPNGQALEGPAGLKMMLKTREAAFQRSLAQKLLTYALGRGTGPGDRAALDAIVAETAGGGGTFSSLVLAIVKSEPFLKRRGEPVSP